MQSFYLCNDHNCFEPSVFLEECGTPGGVIEFFSICSGLLDVKLWCPFFSSSENSSKTLFLSEADPNFLLSVTFVLGTSSC